MTIGAPSVLYSPRPLIILKRAISVTKLGISIPRKNRLIISFLKRN